MNLGSDGIRNQDCAGESQEKYTQRPTDVRLDDQRRRLAGRYCSAQSSHRNIHFSFSRRVGFIPKQINCIG
jgi:hypothetical protein